jgi:hypothetical protein
MKRLALLVLILASNAKAADDIKPPDMSPPDSWAPRQHGSLRVMNKIDSTVQLVDVQVGQTTSYESLLITLSGCFVRPTDLPDDATAHLKIIDQHPDAPGFNGWVLKREPSLNMLQNPVYDVQLASCS